MSDIVKRLRAEATDNRRYEVSGTLATEAAERIEKLEAALKRSLGRDVALTTRIEKLEAALRDILSYVPHGDMPVTIYDNARAALEGK